jgi:hypothetical protein
LQIQKSMKRKKRAAWLILLLLLIASPCFVTYRAVRQEQLNHILTVAIKHNNSSAVLAAIRAGADPNCREYSSTPSPLWKVWLKRLKGDRNPRDRGDPVLSVAFSLHEQYEDFQPPLVVPYQDTSVIKMLVEAGADCNSVTKDGSTPLLQAVEWTGPETVRLLLDHKAAVNVKDKDGITPLLIAVGEPNTTIAKLLVVRGADIAARDNSGLTPLMHAAQEGTPDMVRYLLLQHADKEARDNRGKTALQHAKDAYNFHAARLLKQAGATQ